MNAIALAKPDCLYCRYFYIYRLLNIIQSMCQGNQVADCTETKKLHQKGSKVGKKQQAVT